MASSNEIKTPDFGGATDVTVIEIPVKAGDKVTEETVVLTLESDKATMDLPAGKDGIIEAIKVKIGDKVETDDVLMTLKGGETNQEKAASKDQEPVKTKPSDSQKNKQQTQEEKKEPSEKNKKKKQDTEAEKKETEPTEKSTKNEPEVLTGTLQSENDVHAGPGVRRLAREFGVNLTQVEGSGPKERILKEDVQRYVKQRLSQAPAAATSLPALPAIDFTKFGPIERKELSRIQKISGRNLQRNWMMIPHVTQFGEADITSLEEFRQAQKKSFDKQNIKLTPLVFVMKAVVASLKAFPNFNASLDPKGEYLILKNYFHIGVAVDTPDGLVVPVIRDVDQKGMRELAQELAAISEKARDKQLLPMDMQGSCFSISSLGGIGGTAFTPIINYPEVAILGVSKSFYKPVYKEGEFVPRLMLPLSLSYDHRVVDGADGARFMVHLSNMLSDIRNLLL